RLLFRDNGVGCRKEDGRDDGFGLRLVVAIVEKELGGTLEKSEIGGCTYEIRWRKKERPFPPREESGSERCTTPDLSPA
ncbi:hypothetical protein, partial [Hydrogenimonas sp.]